VLAGDHTRSFRRHRSDHDLDRDGSMCPPAPLRWRVGVKAAVKI
jgi:hypothetical protein